METVVQIITTFVQLIQKHQMAFGFYIAIALVFLLIGSLSVAMDTGSARKQLKVFVCAVFWPITLLYIIFYG